MHLLSPEKWARAGESGNHGKCGNGQIGRGGGALSMFSALLYCLGPPCSEAGVVIMSPFSRERRFRRLWPGRCPFKWLVQNSSLSPFTWPFL